MPRLTPDRSLVPQLRRQLATRVTDQARSLLSTGLAPLDELLPQHGLPSGSLVEWLGDAGSGAATLAWLMAAHFQTSRSVIVVDPQRECFPPGMASLEADLQRVVVIQPRTPTETLWTLEQSLRSQAGAIVMARLEGVTHQTYRRFKLAVERGGGIGLFLRPARYRRAPSWADVRLLCSGPGTVSLPKQEAKYGRFLTKWSLPPTASLARHIHLELLHVRGGGFQQQTTLISINDDACVMSVDSKLARATTARPATRAS